MEILMLLYIFAACMVGFIAFDLVCIILYILLNHRDQTHAAPAPRSSSEEDQTFYTFTGPEPRIVAHSNAPLHTRGELFRDMSRRRKDPNYISGDTW